MKHGNRPFAKTPLPPSLRMGGIAAASVLACALALVVVFGNGNVSYRYDITDELLIDNAVMFAALAAVLVGVSAFLRRRRAICVLPESSDPRRKLEDPALRRICALVCAAVYLVEISIAQFAGFQTGWDVALLSHAAIQGIPADQVSFALGPHDAPALYLSMYPNNLFLFGTLSFLFGLLPNPSVFVMVACGCVSLSIFLVSRIALSLTGSGRCSVASLVLGILLIGLNPWFFIPYSDVFGLVCTTAALWSYACLAKPLLRWTGLFAFSSIGCFLKPTSAFLPCAIMLVSAILFLKRRPFRLRPGLRVVAGALAGCGLAALAFALMVVPTAPFPDRTREFTVAHYLMMGLNEKDGGGYSHEDVGFSLGQPGKEARIGANLEEASNRAADMGFVGTARLFAKKTLANYNDGTFAWGQDKPFFPSEFRGYMDAGDFETFSSFYEDRSESPVSQALASYYWESGRFHHLFKTVQQAVWIATLVGVSLCLLGMATSPWRRLDPRSAATIVALLASLAMLTVFLMVFECRARYLYLYAGLYIVAALWGYRCLFELSRRAASRREPS